MLACTRPPWPSSSAQRSDGGGRDECRRQPFAHTAPGGGQAKERSSDIRRMTTTLAITALIAATTAAASVRPAFLTRMEWAVALCETGGNWKHHTRDYQGAYGFYRGSWDSFRPSSYPSEAYNATPWQQTVVMRRIRARYGWSGWGCVTHNGYRSHM